MNPFPFVIGVALLATQAVDSTPPHDAVAISDNHQQPVSHLLAELTERTDMKVNRLADGGMAIKDEQKGWIFVPSQYASYPAVVEYRLVFGKGKDGLSLGARVQCDIKGPACDELAKIVESNVATANQPGHDILNYVGYSPIFATSSNCPSREVAYPRAALPAEGTVVMWATVGASGPKKYAIERSSKNKYLDEAAFSAFKSWCFRRPESTDPSAEYTVRVPVHFGLPH